jgi:hypothetical protein
LSHSRDGVLTYFVFCPGIRQIMIKVMLSIIDRTRLGKVVHGANEKVSNRLAV